MPLLYTLFDAGNTKEITDRTLENALLCVTETIDKIMTCEIETKDLVISTQLRMDNTSIGISHVAAAIQLSENKRKQPTTGDIIQYIYTDSQHQIPLKRVYASGRFRL